LNIFSIINFLQSKNSPNDRADEGTRYFQDFPDALLNLVVLLTTANNPDGKQKKIFDLFFSF